MVILILLSGFGLCNEEVECNDHIKIEIGKNSHNGDGGRNACSPVCTCVNCFFSVLIPIKPNQPIHFQETDIPYPDKKPDAPIEVTYKIWQPPKVNS